jgi:hypothetical protein
MQARKFTAGIVIAGVFILAVCCVAIAIRLRVSLKAGEKSSEPAPKEDPPAQEQEASPAAESAPKRSSLEPTIRSTPLTPAQETELLKLVQEGLLVPSGIEDVPTTPIVIELKQRFGKHFFPVRLNGVNATAMLDWGGGCFVGMTPSIALRARPRLCEDKTGSTSYEGSEQVRPGVIDELVVGGERIHNVPVLVTESDVDVVIGGLPVLRGQCLIGMPFLAAFRRFAIDLPEGKLYLGCLPEPDADEETLAVPCRYEEAALHVPVKLEEKSLDLLVDIGGSSNVITLHGDVAREFMDTHEYTKGGETTGFGRGTTTWYLAHAESAQLGDQKLARVPVVLIPDTPIPGAGTIGSGLFGPSSVSVDLDSGHLFFVRRPQTHADEPDR